MARRGLWFLAASAILLCLLGCRDARVPELRFIGFPPPPPDDGLASMRNPPPRESLVAILARPADFHGKGVAVQGVLNLELEGNQLCLDRGSLQYFVGQNCLWVSLAEGPIAGYYDEIARWNGQYALLEGEISATNQGHLNLFPAAIINVTGVLFIQPPGRRLPAEQ